MFQRRTNHFKFYYNVFPSLVLQSTQDRDAWLYKQHMGEVKFHLQIVLFFRSGTAHSSRQISGTDL